MKVRKSNEEDYQKIQEIYAYAREFMKKTGNPNQWKDTSPKDELVKEDVTEDGYGYVVVNDLDEIVGVFVLKPGEDPTYSIIEDGQWLNNEPYVTIHRIASHGKEKGIFEECLKFALSKSNNIRVDTHNDNKVMQHVILKNGFKRCGIIYVADGTPRIAFQLYNPNKK